MYLNNVSQNFTIQCMIVQALAVGGSTPVRQATCFIACLRQLKCQIRFSTPLAIVYIAM
jgi:hypothetical protein